MENFGGKAKVFFAKLVRVFSRGVFSKSESNGYFTDNDVLRLKPVEKAKSTKTAVPGKVVINGFLAAFLFTIIILGGLAWYTWHSNQQLKVMETRHFRLLKLSGQIVHIDEVLTMSAHMAVETGEPQWEERYRNFEPQLNSAIKEVKKLTKEKAVRDAITETDLANIRLVELENQAFELVRKNNREEAVNLLHSEEYENQKQIYSSTINNVAKIIGLQEKARIQKEQWIALTTIGSLIITLPLIGFIWFAALRILKKYIAERRRTEHALRMSEQCFSAIADYSYFWEMWVNPHGRLVWTNPAVERITGYNVREVMGLKDFPAPLIDEQDRVKMLKAYKSALGGGTGNDIEFRLVRKNGQIIWASISWQPIYDEKKIYIGFRSSLRDITERKRTEAALQASEERYRSLAENIDIGITLIDADHNIIMANSAVGRMFDADVSEFIGQKCYNKFEKNHDICDHCPGAKAMISGQVEEVETEHIRDDGSLFSVRVQAFPQFDEEGRATGFIEVSEDITARKQTEQVLE